MLMQAFWYEVMDLLKPFDDIFCYTSSFSPIDSRMYVLIAVGDPRCSYQKKFSPIIVDPIIDEKMVRLLLEKNILNLSIILTHEHFDHISGVNFLKDNFKCRVICTKDCADSLSNPRKNLSYYFEALFCMQEEEIRNQVKMMDIKPYSCKADEIFVDQVVLPFYKHKVNLTHTQGHSNGSLCMSIDNRCIFSGDSLLRNRTVVTNLPGGNKQLYNKITLPYINSLPKDILVYPGHGVYYRLSEINIDRSAKNDK